ncbi:Glutathione transport system permease protein gsiD [Metamycoplasma cloacale]|uniref:ABC transporter permease n=1 Tax=Metamycoplasma cloacale TaxID=92401 RepID=A0A2Z4LM95_9BACT|nr:ABC transporter permease subunit [Metamycoplasma cloacale]AWX42598.1 ABC transporter permease [Metamycoplasma cloacale]VEU79668.1 Glutathione transport system permease protein gsiD [Metamycoplasma cloacale]
MNYKIDPSLLKFADKKIAKNTVTVHKSNARLFWERFTKKKTNIVALIFFVIILLSILIATFFIKYSPTNSIHQNSFVVNNLPSEYLDVVNRNFERGDQLDFIRKIAELEQNRATQLGEIPVFKILFDSSRDVGGSMTTNTDIVELWYSPYDLIKAINLNVDEVNKIKIDHTIILGTNSNGIDIFSRLLTSFWLTILIIFTSMIFNIFTGFTLGSLSGLNKEKMFFKFIDMIASFINSIPELIWIFILCIAFTTNFIGIVCAFILISWTTFYELSKNETLQLRHKDFINSAKAIGLNQFQLIYLEIFKIILPSIINLIIDRFCMNLLIISSLSFLDLITNSSNLNIGSILKEAINSISYNPSYLIVVVILITSFTVSLKLFNNSLSQTFNPIISK